MSMNVNGTGSTPYTGAAAYAKKTDAADTKGSAAASTQEMVAEEVAKNEDSFVKSTAEQPVTYKPDMQKVNQMKADMSLKMGAFEKMVQGLFQSQGKQAGMANGMSLKDLFENTTVDPETKAAAQASIEEGGEWSVDAVAGRILEFAKAISGGDPSKIELLRKAVDDGFGAAGKAWGGKLPEISQKTYDKVMAGFDDWAKEASGGTSAPPEATEA